MSNLFLTLVIAFVLIVIAIACLATGWLITGKTKIERGSCGRDPTKKKDANCETTQSCDLCEHHTPHSPQYPKEADENFNNEEQEEEKEQKK
jgi:hypothetical protein